MSEGDTIHRVAGRLSAALEDREIEVAEAPNARSPLHNRAAELRHRVVERVEARGKNLLVHFSGRVVLHSHLGISGRWRIASNGRTPHGRPWLLLAADGAVVTQHGGKRLRLGSAGRILGDPALRRLGPDPLAPGFEPASAAARVLAADPGREVGEALLDQSLIAGIGNAIRNEALFRARVDPWRRIAALRPAEAERVVEETIAIMRTTLRDGRRPRTIYPGWRRGCPSCGGPVSSGRQGDANRITYWCPRCQR